jgi:hypothetical protein
MKARFGFRRRHWGLVVLLVSAATALVLGYVGMRQYYPQPNSWSRADYLFEAFRNFWMWSPQNPERATNTALQIARFIAPLVTLYAGVGALLTLFSSRFGQWWQLKQISDHTIVCGLGRKGTNIAASLQDMGQKVICVDIDSTAPGAATCKGRGLLVVTGDATDTRTLTRLAASRATRVVAVTGDDGLNALVALRIQELVEQSNGAPVTMLTHISDPALCDLLRQRCASTGCRRVDLSFFSIYDGAAAAVLNACPPFSGQRQAEEAPSVLLLGSGPLMQRVPLHLA